MRTSVIIPNYNYAEFLPFAIDSALAQSDSIDEIIVVDDGSADHSKEVLARYGDKIISIFQENQGQASAFNTGFERSTGDIIFFLDADDLFAPNKVETIKALYQTNENVAWIFHMLQHISAQEADTYKDEAVHYDSQDNRMIDQRAKILNGKISYDSPATSGLSFRREFIAPLFPLPVAASVSISDHYIKFYSLSKAAGMHLDTKLGCQIIHDNNFYTGQKSTTALKARIFINTAICLLKVNPHLKRFCNSIFEEGLLCSYKSGIYNEMRPLITSYQGQMSAFDEFYMKFRLFIKKILRRS